MDMERTTVKTWLAENGFTEILAMIEEIEEDWRARGRKTRRNWWRVLAGDSRGKPRVIAGREFPVLKAAQIHEGKPLTKGAITRGSRKEVPSKWTTKWDGTAE